MGDDRDQRENKRWLFWFVAHREEVRTIPDPSHRTTKPAPVASQFAGPQKEVEVFRFFARCSSNILRSCSISVAASNTSG